VVENAHAFPTARPFAHKLHSFVIHDSKTSKASYKGAAPNWGAESVELRLIPTCHHDFRASMSQQLDGQATTENSVTAEYQNPLSQ